MQLEVPQWSLIKFVFMEYAGFIELIFLHALNFE